MEQDLTKLNPDVRRLNDMREVLADKDFANKSPDMDLYYMYRAIKTNNELRYDETVLKPQMLGNEFNKTKGHYHVDAYPEIYMVLEGTAIYLLQKKNITGEIEDVYAVEVKKGECAIMPPFYGHVTINPSETEELKMANWISDSCKSDYSLYIEKQGACYYYTKTGWVKNENYKNVPELRFEKPLKEIPQDLEFLKIG
jgi:glucose-6-phosphate isomerase